MPVFRKEGGGLCGDCSRRKQQLPETQSFQHLLATAADEFAANPMTWIAARFQDNCGHSTPLQPNAEGKAGQATANYGDRF
jgi:hypothetical protein